MQTKLGFHKTIIKKVKVTKVRRKSVEGNGYGIGNSSLGELGMEENNLIPDRLRERIFEQLFEVAEIAKFTPEEMRHYEDSLKYYRDLKNSLDTARDEGWVKGKLEGKQEGIKVGSREEKLAIAQKALSMGMSIPEIMQLTGLSQEAIEQLK